MSAVILWFTIGFTTMAGERKKVGLIYGFVSASHWPWAETALQEASENP